MFSSSNRAAQSVSTRVRPFVGPAAVGIVALMVIGVLPAALGIAALGGASAPRAVTSPLAAGVVAPATSTAALAPPNGGEPAAKGVVFNAPGPRPSSFGASGTPPGWEALNAGGWGGSGGAGSPTGTNWDNRFCAGLWPSVSGWSGTPQGTYASGCYGHDEPGIQFYSSLPGSGGNVTWNVTLPVDANPTHNQSSLYSAVWFGMTLTDPAAWMDQCFLELQFYPDQTFYNPGPLLPNATVNGAWIGAAVAWQIEASTGFENPCFYEPLYLGGTPGPAFLNMTQGDQLVIKMTGWQDSTTGEAITINDQTNGQTSHVTLFNSTGNFPLNPAYATNSFQNGLEWTPGGEYPIAFSFETGHAGNPDFPANNSYGGCSPGIKSTPADPAAPCPSYDPGSWANDTLTPWKIQTPMFFNAAKTTKAAQVAFTQDFGGIDLESVLSGGACTNMAGAGWCSYPWYSYSCAQSAFEFGATDYATFSNDFGKYNEYSKGLEANAAGLGFYPPTNFSIPTCSAPSFTVTVATSGTGTGAAYFLSHAYSAASTAVAGVGPGNYALNAINSGSGKFDHWTTTGLVSVATKTSASTTLSVTGAGTVTAVFSATPRTTTVTFADSPTGTIGVDPSMLFSGPFTGNGNPIGTISAGGTLALAPGVYTVQAYPSPGEVFSSWSAGSGLSVAAPSFPMTWVTVLGGATTATLTAHYAKSPATEVFFVAVSGAGNVTVDSHTVTGTATTSGFATLHPTVGTYTVVSVPSGGNDFVQYGYLGASVLSNYSLTTKVTVEAGIAELEVFFVEEAAVTLVASPSTSGAITLVPVIGPAHASASGSTVVVSPGTYTVTADPFGGELFSSWTVSGGATLGSATSPVTTLTVTSAATVTAKFIATTKVDGVKFIPSPVNDGTIQLDGMSIISTASTNSTLAPGIHFLTATPATGFLFSSWTVGSHVSFVGGPTATDQEINVTGTGSSVTAVFTPGTYPFTFVAIQAATSNITVKVNGVILHSGDTTDLPSGHYSAPFAGGGLGFNGGWTATSNITFTAKGTTSAGFFVNGSGTLYLILVVNGTGNGSGGVAFGLALHPGVAATVPFAATLVIPGRPY